MRVQVSHRAAQVYVAVIGQMLATTLSLLTWSAVINECNQYVNRIPAEQANHPPQRATVSVT